MNSTPPDCCLTVTPTGKQNATLIMIFRIITLVVWGFNFATGSTSPPLLLSSQWLDSIVFVLPLLNCDWTAGFSQKVKNFQHSVTINILKKLKLSLLLRKNTKQHKTHCKQTLIPKTSISMHKKQIPLNAVFPSHWMCFS